MTRLVMTLVSLFAVTTQATMATDFSNVRSGLLLGVYATAGHGGMRVSNTIPGYSAQGRLYPGDVLLRATVDGWTMHHLRSHYEMENAKLAIGAGREAAVEIWRPGTGLIYAWVEFMPIYGPAAAYSVHGSGVKAKAQARFRMESEKPGARRLFQRNGTTGFRPHNHDRHQTRLRTGNSQSAANLFNRYPPHADELRLFGKPRDRTPRGFSIVVFTISRPVRVPQLAQQI